MEVIIDTIPRTPEQYRRWWSEGTDVPYGYCWCGCEEKTSIASQNNAHRCCVKGEPRRYSGPGHHTRISPVAYIVEDRGYKTPCWVCQRAVGEKGYCYIRIKGVNYLAHRVYYERENGPIPEELQLDHLCAPSGGPRTCIRPDHLEAVTGTINQRRGKGTKLSLEKVRCLRMLYATGDHSFASLARQFGVGKTTVRNAVNGKNWK